MFRLHKRATLAGFTLIELLVVISIIALLVSILLPALNKAREQARTVKCAAHLKQMALAMHMYADAYDGYFPAMLMPGNLSTVYPGKSHWHQLVLPLAERSELLQCPSLIKNPMVQWDDQTFITGYGLNYNGWNWIYETEWDKGSDPDGGFGYVIPEYPRGGCIKNVRVRWASEFIMLGDSNGNKQTDPLTIKNNYTYGIIGPPRVLGKMNTLGDMPNVHSSGGNIAFTDGHVKWYSTDDLLSDEMLYMWNRGGGR